MSFFVLYSIVSYLYSSCSRCDFVCYRLLVCDFCSEKFPLPLGAWDGLCYCSVALHRHSI